MFLSRATAARAPVSPKSKSLIVGISSFVWRTESKSERVFQRAAESYDGVEFR